MATTLVDGITLAYVDEGFGDPVVLLHGWGGQAASMTPLITGLRQQYRIVAFDLPGFGGSSPPPVPWGTPEYAAFVEKAVASLGIARATYVGHSFGGRIALWLSSHRPEIVQALVLVDAAGIKPPTTVKRRMRLIVYKTARMLLRLPILGAKGPALQERLAMRFGSADYKAVSGVMRSSFVKTVNLDLSDCMHTITAPTLLIWGEKDQATPITDGRTMERLIQGSRLIAVAGAGHFSYLDSPSFVNAVVSAFLHGTREGQVS
ncbi:MAG TPA: alpha/beta hydrolase [Clostridia bacterium]|nr:alpha/beta hydrolase [Clostridia bacterium]